VRIKTAAEWNDERDALLEALRDFARVMKHRPFNNREGLRGVSAFALFWFVRRLAPSVIFEVGVWRGFSTWLIEQAAPAAEVHCFDPLFMLQHLIPRWRIGKTYRSKRAHYSTQDFSCAPIRVLAAGRSDALAFFDDHQNKLPRVLQCKAAGIKNVIFDDNMAAPYTHRTLEHERASDPAALEREIESYEIFPALWPVDFHYAGMNLKESGMDFPVDRELRDVYRDRDWHSYVTYVRLK
jgi:hypothetical protein